MQYILFSLILCFQFSQAQNIFSPPALSYREANAVFVDFQSAHYRMDYYFSSKSLKTYTEISFVQEADGYPIIELVPHAVKIFINGSESKLNTVITPNNTSSIRVVDTFLRRGQHQLVIESTTKQNLRFEADGIRHGFWFSDLDERQFLEQYLPTNLEFDSYKMQMHIKIHEANTLQHKIYTNAVQNQIAPNEFSLDFPDFFNASAMYFHLTAASRFHELEFEQNSIRGHNIPTLIYCNQAHECQQAESIVKEVIPELENDYGPWPHEKLLIYVSGNGGMEYSGATMTSTWALGHELQHSYHARALHPANANAGWIDEAIASWRDNSYNRISTLNSRSLNMADRSPYIRSTPMGAYDEGAYFLAWLDYDFSLKGLSFKSFLAHYFDKYKYQAVSTEVFKSEIEAYSQKNYTREFNYYIYGNNNKNLSTTHSSNPYHPKLSQAELLELL